MKTQKNPPKKRSSSSWLEAERRTWREWQRSTVSGRATVIDEGVKAEGFGKVVREVSWKVEIGPYSAGGIARGKTVRDAVELAKHRSEMMLVQLGALWDEDPP